MLLVDDGDTVLVNGNDCKLDADWKSNLVTVEMDEASPVTNHPVSQLRNCSRFLTTGDAQHTGPLGMLGFL